MSKVSRRERQALLHRQKQKQRLTWGVLGLGVILIFVALIWSRSNQVVATDDRFDAEMVALGRQVYDEKCAICHGEELEGEVDWRQSDPSGVLKAPPHDETGHTWHHADAYLIESIKLGGSRLPADVGISPIETRRGYSPLQRGRGIGAIW